MWICLKIQPENILVDAKGQLCLADMGLSKILGTGDSAVRTTTVCGTRAYLAPEMILRKPYGLSVDFWQFGCFIYELYAVSHVSFLSVYTFNGLVLSLHFNVLASLLRSYTHHNSRTISQPLNRV